QLAALVLEQRAEQRGEHQRLGEHPADRRGVSVRAENLVEHWPEPHRPAARVAGGDRETQHPVVAGLAGGDMRGQAHSWPKTQRSTDFWAWMRFSASSHTADCGPSITASVTSSPRCAGRQWRKVAPGAALASSASLTW